MAKKQDEKTRYAAIHKLKASVVLLAIFVVAIAGMMGKVSLTTILVRSTVVFLVVVIGSRIAIQILKTNEEMNSGEG